MARPKTDLHQKVKDLLRHVGPMPAEAVTPITHYRQSARDTWILRKYLVRKTLVTHSYDAVRTRHISQLDTMFLVQLIESLERFLKESAALCLDHLVPVVTDDRLRAFSADGSVLAVHFRTSTLGKALFESIVWLDCKTIRERFAKLLAPTPGETVLSEGGTFEIFQPYPPPKPAKGARKRAAVASGQTAELSETLEILWQIRHTIVHNVAVVTRSDAARLHRLTGDAVAAPALLRPIEDDIRHVKRFLDETAEILNQRIGVRLADLMTGIHTTSPTLFDPRQLADQMADDFQVPITIAGQHASP